MKVERLSVITKVGPAEPVEWSSALHLAPKADNDLRACVDLRPLNAIMQLDHHPLPSLRAFKDKLRGATVFSCLNLRSAYYNIPLD